MRKTPSIKSFIYLDDYKLYSLSSQLFSGFSNEVISIETSKHSEDESQKGNFFTGNTFRDLLTKEHTETEKKLLHDWAFNRLEEALIDNELLYQIKQNDSLESIRDKSIIKVSGRAVFNDYEVLSATLENFNSIGESFGFLQLQDNIIQFENNTNFAKKNTKDRNGKAKITAIQKSTQQKLDEILEATGLRLHPLKVQHMVNLLKYGYHGELEFRVMPENIPFQVSAILNRSYLRDQEKQFVSKYSRKSEFDFTMIGIVTQAGNPIRDEAEKPMNGMKEACLVLADRLNIMEKSFLGRMAEECIIDPIAIYREL